MQVPQPVPDRAREVSLAPPVAPPEAPVEKLTEHPLEPHLPYPFTGRQA